ncbi:glycerophosphodiester phosphodiesterase family protein [Lacinutrix neustonica]|uniref:Glycerophosphodiester phosphodiesterase family protein n=1 Tax=Lacinutrix neustonica TaxID=2980107 RepID=A0A9E8MVN5_9FLAO|nr:glycerophosphodiester phosphodiesterase family protein [Lacinutrix neustonica]WAC01467.1 glycerophosphodiester phosphodiesterase family protein [Lacinutrix neustonica]
MKEEVSKIGHRGAKGYVTENTLASIQKAMDLGVDGIEIDIHRCKTGELVVFHDFAVDRLSNGHGDISNFTLPELKNLKLKGAYEIPTLAEVFDLVDDKCLLNIELKGLDTVQGVVTIIEDYVKNTRWTYKNILVSSFQHPLLIALRALNKKVSLGVLTDTNLKEAMDVARNLKALAIHPDFVMLTKENVVRDKG